MIRIYRYILGRIRVRFYGEFPERILNLCAVNGITLWGAKSVKDGIRAYITVRDFLNIRNIRKGTGIRVHIEEKSGLPFLISRYRKRVGLTAGTAMLLLFLQLMSGFIWNIEIVGNSRVTDSEIMSALNKIGIYEGIPSGKIESKSQREKLLLEIDSLAWCSLNVEGCRLTVNVSEAKEKAENESQPCNLKSEFDGIVKKIDITAGNCVVKVGDTVKKGDVLVSGIIENAGGTRFVSSSGTVTAEVKHTFTLSDKYKKTEIKETGTVKKRCVLEFFTLKIPLFLGSQTGTYNEELETKSLSLLGEKLPIRLYKKKFRITKEVTVIKNKEQLISGLEAEMEKLLKKEKITDYSIISKEFTETDDGVTLNLTVSTEQNIAYRDFLLISTGN